MTWMTRLAVGFGLALVAGMALAHPPMGGPAHYPNQAYFYRDAGYSLPTYGDVPQHYGHPVDCHCRHHAPPPPCNSGCGGLTLAPGFTFNGGVGDYPQGGYGGGGVVVYGGGAQPWYQGGSQAMASSSSSALAISKSTATVQFSTGGGFAGGHYGGGCNGYCGKGH